MSDQLQLHRNVGFWGLGFRHHLGSIRTLLVLLPGVPFISFRQWLLLVAVAVAAAVLSRIAPFSVVSLLSVGSADQGSRQLP